LNGEWNSVMMRVSKCARKKGECAGGMMCGGVCDDKESAELEYVF
jgi:hypothetical protein